MHKFTLCSFSCPDKKEITRITAGPLRVGGGGVGVFPPGPDMIRPMGGPEHFCQNIYTLIVGIVLQVFLSFCAPEMHKNVSFRVEVVFKKVSEGELSDPPF